MPSFGLSATRRHPYLASKLFNGDAKQQIDALRDYLMHLELKPATPTEDGLGNSEPRLNNLI